MFSRIRRNAALLIVTTIILALATARHSTAQKPPNDSEATGAAPAKVKTANAAKKAATVKAPAQEAAKPKPLKHAGPFEKGNHVESKKQVSAEFKKPGHLGVIFKESEKFDADLQGQLAKALKEAPIPQARLVAFAEFDRPDIRLNGWRAKLLSVDSAKSTVTLHVIPLISTSLSSSPLVTAYMIELYSFKDGKLKLLNAQRRGNVGYIIGG